MIEMEQLTLVQIRDFVIVTLAVLAFIVLLGNVVKTIKEWRKPGMTVEQWRSDMDESMKDNTERIKSLEDGNKVIMKALVAMLNHEINGNSVDKLQKALADLNEYLIER